MRFFKDEHLIALTSDASIDFTPLDFDAPLSDAQQIYLRHQTGIDIPYVFWRKQVHGNDVLIASDVHAGGCPDADAYVTNQPHVPLAIRTADCVPVFIFDPIKKAIGLAHAGWKGTYKTIAVETIKQMQDKFGSKCYDLKVVLGPSIRSCCYQVGEEFKGYFPDHITQRNGHLYADVVGANINQLLNAGVKKENIVDCGICTCCNPNYFSFRRDGQKAGRMISLMML